MSEWKRIESGINSYLETTKVICQYRNNADLQISTPKDHLKKTEEILSKINNFITNFERTGLLISIENVKKLLKKIKNGSEDIDKKSGSHIYPLLIDSFSILADIREIIKYDLSDTQKEIRRHIGNAFVHLQYSIIADEEIQKKWHSVWETEVPQKEIKFETMGRNHLLSHKIWAHKIKAPKEETDLVLKELEEDPNLSPEGASLTEWKIANNKKEYNHVIDIALEQSHLYTERCLFATKLKNTIYLVIVSQEKLSDPEDREKDGKIFRIINIHTKPKNTSEQAKKILQRKRNDT